MSAATAVVVHAHPDDEAIFTGATIHRLTSSGVRVVLVTATAGEAGEPRVRLAPGETLASRRLSELEEACEVLGVARLVVLGYEDSGARSGPFPAGTLGAADPGDVARRVTTIASAEGAGAVIHYDPQGIYGHVDHVAVHRAGAEAARRLGVTAYEATVDNTALRAFSLGRAEPHVLHAAAGAEAEVGVPAEAISLSVGATPAALAAKRAAMAAHASQIGPGSVSPDGFDAGYGREWFVRRGAPGLLETLTGADPASLVHA